VVGAGKHHLSGITYYTYGLVEALAAHRPTTAILLRRLVPRRWYPGADRVGADLSHVRLPASVRRYDGVDWWWGPSLLRAVALLVRRPPAVVVVQWWSAAVWHTELALVLVARAVGAKVVLDVHEVIDSGELARPVGRLWLRLFAPPLLRRADAVVVHSESDRELVTVRLGVDPSRLSVIPVPPLTSYDMGGQRAPVEPGADGTCSLLFFGTIRPYKGLEHLVTAFEQLCAGPDGDRWRLTVVGETWEGWTLPGDMIARSPVRDRITFVNRYVRDEEVDLHLAAADIVVLPYLRSSTSGPLLVAMAYGLPVVATRVGGLPQSTEGYAGAVLAEPGDPDDLVEAILKAEVRVGVAHVAPRTWNDTARAHLAVHAALGARR
jgi:glycosyltransferase involved in cell wall biosynthesis